MPSVDELLERDKQREKDGFPRKIKIGKIVKPGKRGKDRFIMVPTTIEEKLYHDKEPKPQEEEDQTTGSAEGEEGDVIGEQCIDCDEGEGEEGDDSGAGEDGGGEHEIESEAYELGKSLVEKFELPNIKDKGKKRAIDQYKYDLTDKHKRFGQILDKKATLIEIIKTNLALGRGNLPDIAKVDPTDFIIAPDDKIYRVLSRERVYESQAMVFFIRDYSASMGGRPTEVVVGQHLLIYSWLVFQYQGLVETRFILHDTDAKEVNNFNVYYNSRIAGGTKVSTGFELVNKIVEEEGLAKDYNIYVFYGTDGDDWDDDGKNTVKEIKKILEYCSRMGITIIERKTTSPPGYDSTVETYLKKVGFVSSHKDLFRLDTLTMDVDEKRLVEGIKKLISED